tara:strand:- start:1859 stop:2305 length:447 start_codon:yes stop_codon:yes gene_type:complete
MPSEAYEVLWVVEAESGHLAREKVVANLAQLTMLPNADFRDFSLSFVEPVQVGSDEGWQVLSTFWDVYVDLVGKDVEVLSGLFDGESEEVAERLRNSLEFKSACYRVGTISGWPIRIYWDGIGLNFPSQIESLRRDDPGAWIVTVQLS